MRAPLIPERLAWRRAACAFALVLLLFVVGACGNGTASLTPRQVVLGAATKTTGASSSKFSMDLQVQGATSGTGTGTEAPTDVKVTGSGAFDYGDHRGTMRMTIPAGASTIDLETVMIGTVVYEKLPASVAGMAPGGAAKPWIKIDLAKLGDIGGGLNLGTLASAQSADPSQAVAYLRGVSTDVKVVGEEKLRGADVTHYRFTIDLAKAAKSAPESQRALLQQAADLYGGGTPIPADAWVDGDGRLRKMSYVIDRSNVTIPTDQAASGETFGRIVTSFELYDFGTEVAAKAPPADQVTDIGSLLPGDSGSSSGSATFSGSGSTLQG
jgi:hypothetical protein